MNPRCYTIAQLVSADLLNMPRRTFFTLKQAGRLPFLEELRPRIGRRARYRADLVDSYLANQWGQRSVGAPPHKIAPPLKRAG